MSTLLYLPGGKVRMLNSTVRMLLKTAYQFQDFQIVGGPGWINSDRYDLETSAVRDATREEYKIMLQAMLADRFNLKSHRENREGIEYELVVGRNGHKITRSAEPGAFRGGRGRITGTRTMSQLAEFLSRVVYSPVADKTNLNGPYDITLEWTPDELIAAGNPAPASAPSIFTAVEEQLGLRLVSHKGPFLDVLVIDSITKPTEN